MYPKHFYFSNDRRKVQLPLNVMPRNGKAYGWLLDGLLDFTLMAMILSLAVLGILAIGL